MKMDFMFLIKNKMMSLGFLYNIRDAWLNSLGQDFNNGENLLKKKL